MFFPGGAELELWLRSGCEGLLAPTITLLYKVYGVY